MSVVQNVVIGNSVFDHIFSRTAWLFLRKNRVETSHGVGGPARGPLRSACRVLRPSSTSVLPAPRDSTASSARNHSVHAASSQPKPRKLAARRSSKFGANTLHAAHSARRLCASTTGLKMHPPRWRIRAASRNNVAQSLPCTATATFKACCTDGVEAPSPSPLAHVNGERIPLSSSASASPLSAMQCSSRYATNSAWHEDRPKRWSGRNCD
mmetsp:Transcript_43013/g.100800  ORF Transcript_43013/g.100800 Transcript_43013/m.100800 type:complete len:211 (+) Transcript_43013:250-882(+)